MKSTYANHDYGIPNSYRIRALEELEHKTVAEVSRELGLDPSTLYLWKKSRDAIMKLGEQK